LVVAGLMGVALFCLRFGAWCSAIFSQVAAYFQQFSSSFFLLLFFLLLVLRPSCWCVQALLAGCTVLGFFCALWLGLFWIEAGVCVRLFSHVYVGLNTGFPP